MTTELDKLAKKNTEQKLDAAQKNLNIKEHNIKAAQKASDADTPWEDRSTLEKFVGTKKHFKLAKEKKKVQKTEKFLDKQAEKLEKHGVWSKENKKGSSSASLEKDDIIEKGFPSKAKMDIDVHRPGFPVKKKYMSSGGIIKGFPKMAKKGWK